MWLGYTGRSGAAVVPPAVVVTLRNHTNTPVHISHSYAVCFSSLFIFPARLYTNYKNYGKAAKMDFRRREIHLRALIVIIIRECVAIFRGRPS